MVDEKIIILRSTNSKLGDLELFIGDGVEGESYIISYNRQLDWLNTISASIRKLNRNAF